MASNDYVFITHWRVPGTVVAVYEILINGVDFVRWWPEVYLEVEETASGGEHGLGKAARLLTKGWLPYRLRWRLEVIECHWPFGFAIRADGDFIGRGVWIFAQQGPDVAITFDWRLRAEKPLLRWLSFILKPVFRANHAWAMARGEEGLRSELLRRKASAEAARGPARRTDVY